MKSLAFVLSRQLVLTSINNKDILLEDIVEGGRLRPGDPVGVRGVVVGHQTRLGRVGLSKPLEKHTPGGIYRVVDGSGKVVADSRISFISPKVDNTTQTVLVKAAIAKNQDELRNSQFIRARVVWGRQNKPVVPVLAVLRIGAQYFAFIAEDQNGKTVAHQKPLQVGEIVGNDYVVLNGIKPGDKIIVSGTQFLVDGAPVVPQG